MLKRKKTIRNATIINQNNNLKNFTNMYGSKILSDPQRIVKGTIMQTLMMVNKHEVLKNIAFDSDAQILHKKTENKRASEMALMLAKEKKNEVTYNLNVPTIITEPAPGYPIDKPKDRKYNRIKLKPKA